MVDIKMQVVVGRGLEGDELVPLRVQKRNAAVDDTRKSLRLVESLRGPNDRELADTICWLAYRRTVRPATG